MGSENPKINVGIIIHSSHSFFSNGGPSVAYSLAEMYGAIGQNVCFVNSCDNKAWYDDCTMLKDKFPVVSIKEFLREENPHEKLDVILDIDGYGMPSVRQKIGKHVVVILRKASVVQEIESVVYPSALPHRSFQGVSMVWMWDTFTPQDVHAVELLSRCPVVQIPYLWSPAAIEAHRNQMGFPEWFVMNQHYKSDETTLWEGHIAETNNSVTSNCTIPVVIMAHAVRNEKFPCKKYYLHNAEHLKENEFFTKNVFAHCQADGLEIAYAGRQRCTDWRVHKKSFVVTHGRFLQMRYYYLDLAWNGIPFIHNNPTIKAIGHGLERLYYEENSITGGAQALKNMNEDFKNKEGIFNPENIVAIRKHILENYGINEHRARIYYGLLHHAHNMKAAVIEEEKKPLPLQFTMPSYMAGGYGLLEKAIMTGVVDPSLQSTIIVSKEKEENESKEELTEKDVFASMKSGRGIHVCFADMWADFNPYYNFFTLLLEEANRHLKEEVYIVPCKVEDVHSKKVKPDVVIFGPFGESWKTLDESIPKIHYTGENSGPVVRNDVFLNLGYKQMVGDDTNYIRLPLWMLEIDWFGADPEKIVNPKPLHLDTVCNGYNDLIEKKDRFCAFVVTNGRNPIRNASFHWLNGYKKVDSAGRLYNNIGDEIFAGLGGGGGELKKHIFLQKYKFCLSFENESSEGYTTEKILHAKAAGCIPIYWGDPFVNRDFDGAGFLNAQHITNADDLIALVKSVDENPELYEKMMAVPALDEYRRDLVRRRFSYMVEVIYKKLGVKTEGLPRFLGAVSCEEAAELRSLREVKNTIEPTVKVPAEEKRVLREFEKPLENIVLVTYATKDFLPALLRWLDANVTITNPLSHRSILVYLGDDVTEDSSKAIQDGYPLVNFCRLPKLDVPGFDDIWAGGHYAWKLYILQDISKNPEYNGRVVLYSDSASMWVRMPNEFIGKALEKGVCVLDDDEQKNRSWCHSEFCDALGVTEAEKDKEQILAAIMCFVAGHPNAVKFFDEAWSWGQQRKVIVGAKWEGFDSQGKPYGHRHDQSIMSILSLRHDVGHHPLRPLYCDESLRRTFKSGACIYVHRNTFKVHEPFLPKIDEAHIINLPRRKDRITRFKENHDAWTKKVLLRSAVDGRALQMTPAIARLFAPNDFHWKKAILGCALSHLSLWAELAGEKDRSIDNYLVLEDDVKFRKGWEHKWKEAAAMIPDDYDILYLGGILPPNRVAYESVLEKVNDHWSVVKDNQIFGQKIPNSYFHYCNYSYVIRKRAAQKILDRIQSRQGYFTSADHMICNQIDMLKMYALTPLVAGCYQDDDPKYATSQFNNYGRVDNFDSDLWNNDERFSVEDLQGCGELPAELNIRKALGDAYATKVVEKTVEKKPEVALAMETIAQPQFLVVGPHKGTTTDMMEHKWLQYLMKPLGKSHENNPVVNYGSFFNITHVEMDHTPYDNAPVFCVQRPHVEIYRIVFDNYEKAGKDYYVIHFSDEFGSDDLRWYKNKHCKGIVRFYNRSDIPAEAKEKVTVIPLGYNKHTESAIEAPWMETPGIPYRRNVWSFHGTKWFGREDKLRILQNIQPHNVSFYQEWKDPKQLNETEYVGVLLNSIFVPCPRGNNYESFRIYEALEHGAIPLCISEENSSNFFEYMNGKLPLLQIPSWSHCAGVMDYFMKPENAGALEAYRTDLLMAWSKLKQELCGSFQKTLALPRNHLTKKLE